MIEQTQHICTATTNHDSDDRTFENLLLVRLPPLLLVLLVLAAVLLLLPLLIVVAAFLPRRLLVRLGSALRLANALFIRLLVAFLGLGFEDDDADLVRVFVFDFDLSAARGVLVGVPSYFT